MSNIHDVAKRAGVSTATVSRVLTRPALVSPETCRRVLQAVRHLDYAPNAAAKNLRTLRTGNLLVTVPDISNLGQNRANCNQDIRQNFSGSFVVATPKFSSSLLQKVAGNWQVSPIIRINSALPINPAAGRDNALNGDSTNQRPNLIGNRHADQQSLAHWFNTAAFAANGPGQLGSAGRNILRGAKTTTINVALSRKFAVNDRQNLELRAEAFNLPNLVNPMADANTGTITSPLFGKISAAGDPRILQFALKYAF